MKKIWIALAGIAMAMPPVDAGTYYVSPNGDDGNSGLSWDAAKNTIQAAINVAEDGNTVMVTNGTYAGNGNRDLDFAGKNIVLKSVGGPAVTLIDCQASYADGHRGFYLHSGETTNSLIEGFTIKNANQTWGGGVYCENAGVTLRNCSLIANKAESLNGNGGGCFFGNSTSVIDRCTISSNQALATEGGGNGWGGGIGSQSSCLLIQRGVVQSVRNASVEHHRLANRFLYVLVCRRLSAGWHSGRERDDLV